MSQSMTAILNDPAVLILYDEELARINREYVQSLEFWTEALRQTAKRKTDENQKEVIQTHQTERRH